MPIAAIHGQMADHVTHSTLSAAVKSSAASVRLASPAAVAHSQPSSQSVPVSRALEPWIGSAGIGMWAGWPLSRGGTCQSRNCWDFVRSAYSGLLGTSSHAPHAGVLQSAGQDAAAQARIALAPPTVQHMRY